VREIPGKFQTPNKTGTINIAGKTHPLREALPARLSEYPALLQKEAVKDVTPLKKGRVFSPWIDMHIKSAFAHHDVPS